MRVYIFNCSTQRNRYGLTLVQDGSNLPANMCKGGWIPNHQPVSIEINAGDPPLISGIRPEVVIEHIERDGYYIVDITITTSERIVPA
jgi:hypothetical protein